MNRSILAFALAASVLAATVAAPAAAADGTATLVVSCQPGSRPSLRAIGDLLGIDNPAAAYQARSRVMAQVRSACQRAGIVRVTAVGRAVPALVAGR
jgi:hypothetical protein